MSSNRPLMFDQQSRDLQAQLAWLTPPWVPMADRPPPGPGYYLVTVSIDVHDDGELRYSVRLDRWDGQRWPEQGGYVTIEAWHPLPVAWSPHKAGCLSLDNVLGRHGCDCR
jgi:hypothetical protein